MATELGKAYVQIIPSAQGISGAIEAALGNEATAAGTKSGANFAGAMGKGIATAGAVTAAAATAAAAAIAGVSKAIVDGTGEIAEYGDNIDKMSQKMGISAQAYQEWDAVMQHSGTSVDGMQRGMTTLSKQAEKGSEAFQKLGISQKDVATMSKEDLFSAVITGLQGMEEGTERTVLAQQLLGGAAKELGPLLNTSAAETQAMKERVHELGGVMSDEAVKAAAHYQDSLQDMTTAFEGVKRGMLSEFLPSITTVMDGLTELFSGNSDKGIGMINEGISAFIDKMSEVLPKVIDAGSRIVGSLLEAIISNLPQMIEAGVQTLTTLARGIMDNLPMLVDSAVQIITLLGKFVIENLPLLIESGLQIILQLASAIAEALPELIPSIVDIVLKIVDILIDNVDLLIDGAIALILGLTEGMIDAMPVLIERMPEIVIKIVEALIRNAPKILEASVQLIVMLAQGLVTNLPKLIETCYQLVTEIVAKFIAEAPQMVKGGSELLTQLINGIKDVIPMLLELPSIIIGRFSETLLTVGTALIEVGRDIGDFVYEGLKDMISAAASWGADMIDNFVNGIKEKASAIGDAVSAAAETVADFLHFSEPDKGPLSNFSTYAPDMMKLFAQGIKDNTDLVTEQIQKSFDIKDTIMNGMNTTTGNSSQGKSVSGGFVQNLTINAPTELDPSEIARQTRNMNREMMLQLRMV